MFSLNAEFTFIVLSSIALAAILSSSVGHGGASGYLAVMALFGMQPALMKPAVLTMNIFYHHTGVGPFKQSRVF